MPYEEASFRGFGSGLNLRDKPDAVDEREAIDALNVLYTEKGAVKSRPGWDEYTASPLTNAAESLSPHYRSAGTAQLLAGCGTRLEAIPNGGGAPTSLTGLTTGTWDFARFGSPNNERTYAGQGEQTLRRWDGSAWSAIASTPAAGALDVMAVSNRLVAGRFNTTTGGPTGGAGTSSPSHVYFSNAGDPETWDANNFIQLTPGDAEKVQAVVAWREFVFIFKESKFFVVYGESVDSPGGPVFDYRAVDTGVGLVSPRAVVAAEEGVYFLHRTGVYVTNGAEPVLVSDPVEPIFMGGSSDFYLGGELAHGSITNCAMGYWDNRLYLAFPTQTTNDRTLVYDPTYKWWSLYDIPATCFAPFRPTDKPELFFGHPTTKHVNRHASTYTNDGGSAITSRWRSGWFDYDVPDVKTIRESKVWGSGVVNLGVSYDFDAGTGLLSQLDMTDPAVTTWGGSTWGGGSWSIARALLPALRRTAVRGTTFSTYFENATLNQEWAVHRASHMLREQRIPSVKTA